MEELEKIINDIEEIVSYFQAKTITTDFETKARNVLKYLKEQPNVVMCKECRFGYQDDASLSLGTVRCSKLNGFKLENWYCGDGKPKED